MSKYRDSLTEYKPAPRFCIDCKHAKPRLYCSYTQPGSNKIANNLSMLDQAWVVRLDKCGLDAIWFEPKEGISG